MPIFTKALEILFVRVPFVASKDVWNWMMVICCSAWGYPVINLLGFSELSSSLPLLFDFGYKVDSNLPHREQANERRATMGLGSKEFF